MTRKSVVYVTHEGKDIRLVDLAKLVGISSQSMHLRYQNGDRGVRLLRPRQSGSFNYADPPTLQPQVDSAMRRLIDRWNAAVFGVGAAV